LTIFLLTAVIINGIISVIAINEQSKIITKLLRVIAMLYYYCDNITDDLKEYIENLISNEGE